MNALDQFSLKGRRALITGSSRGIGRALAEGLAGAGAEIIINSRDTEALGAVASDMAMRGISVRALAFDVTSEESVADAVEWCEAELGPIDILVNNAGMQHRAPLEDYPLDKFERLFATNVTSAFIVGQAVARHMLGRGYGKIINICSVQTALARPQVTPYAASKAAIANLTRGMAAEWAGRGLTINGLAPGYILTDMNSALLADPEFKAFIERRTPAGRWADPDELIGAAIFLASDASRFVNGHILYVDGGLTATV